MTAASLDRPEREAARAAAELVGRLLLVEIDADTLASLRAPGVREALVELGIDLPSEADEQSWLDERAADYHDLFLNPEGGPLVQSLWIQGRYEGDATVRVRELARAANLEFQRDNARSAAPDHLGSLLLLWAASESSAPAIADEIAAQHLAWSAAPLARIVEAGGFYGAVAEAALALVEVLGCDPS